jgi:hypothetical protein
MAPTEQTSPPAPTRWRGWHPAAWFVLAAVAIAYAVGVAAVTFLAAWGLSTTCGEAPTAEQVRDGRLGMLAIAGVGLAPWGLAAIFVRPRARLVVAGLFAVAPALVALVAGLDPDFWRGSFCF